MPIMSQQQRHPMDPMKHNNWIFGVVTILLSSTSVTSFTLPSSNIIPRRHAQSSSTSSFPSSTSPIRLSAESNDEDADAKKIVVIGNGMVGQRFMENLLELTNDKPGAKSKCTLATFCEEPRAAYNRVKLTSYFETRDPSDLTMTGPYETDGRTAWYEDNGVELYLNDKAVAIDTDSKTITGESGREIPYDVAVLATGSYPFVPPIPGRHRPGVFVGD